MWLTCCIVSKFSLYDRPKPKAYLVSFSTTMAIEFSSLVMKQASTSLSYKTSINLQQPSNTLKFIST